MQAIRLLAEPNPDNTICSSRVGMFDNVVQHLSCNQFDENISINFNSPIPQNIIGNQNALTQSFCNFLQNSVEAIQEKRKKVPKFKGAIHINLKQTPNTIELDFLDNGIGFENDLASKIINPLYTTKKGKTGLGLTVAFQIVLEHRAQMNISSQTMEGTKVKIYFKRPDYS